MSALKAKPLTFPLEYLMGSSSKAAEQDTDFIMLG